MTWLPPVALLAGFAALVYGTAWLAELAKARAARRHRGQP